MTYEEIEGILKNNHFYPVKNLLVGKTNEIVSLELLAEPILADDKMKRIEEVLREAGADCLVHAIRNQGTILITKKP